VVTTYQQAGGSVIAKVHLQGSVIPTTIPYFAGSGASTAVVFTDDQTHATVLTAKQYAVSAPVQTAIGGSGVQMTATIYREDPAALAAVMADARHVGLAYSFLYGDTSTQAYDASWTPIQASD